MNRKIKRAKKELQTIHREIVERHWSWLGIVMLKLKSRLAFECIILAFYLQQIGSKLITYAP